MKKKSGTLPNLRQREIEMLSNGDGSLIVLVREVSVSVILTATTVQQTLLVSIRDG